MSQPIFYGAGARGISEERHLRFQRTSTFHGNWERRERPYRGWGYDLAKGLIGAAALFLLMWALPDLRAAALAFFVLGG